MNLKLTAASAELLHAQPCLNGTFSICFQQPGAPQRLSATLRVEQEIARVRLELRAFGTVNSCHLPLTQAARTLHYSAQRFLEDCANGQAESGTRAKDAGVPNAA